MSAPPVRSSSEAPLPSVRLILRRVWWVTSGAAAGLVLGVVIGLLRPPVYESTAYLTVSSDTGQDAGSLAREAQALARLGTAPGVVGDELAAAGLPEAAAEPRLFVRLQAAPDAPVFSVTGTASDPDDARAIALAVSQALAEIDPLNPFRANVASSPPLPDEPTVPGWVATIGGTGLGAGLGLVVAATVPGRRTRARATG